MDWSLQQRQLSDAITYISETWQRPSVVYQAKIYPDGDMWCALICGANIQEGVCAFGKTPAEAAWNLDMYAWLGLLPPDKQKQADAIAEEEKREEVLANGQFGAGA